MTTYTVETLKELNPSYHHKHLLNLSDVVKSNNWVYVIQSSRNDKTPQIGDIVQFTDQYGDYYENAHIEQVGDDALDICKGPMIPFVGKDSDGNLSASTSGGSWTVIPRDLELVGTRQKLFKDWGHCGPSGDGAVVFFAEVNVWEYAEKDLEFTTKTHDKFNLIIKEDISLSGYKYIVRKGGSSYTAFKKQEEYQAWLQTFGGIERDSYYQNEKLVWTLKQVTRRVPLEEYLSVNGVKDTEMNNGSVQECKRVIAGTSITTYLPYEKIEVEDVRYRNAYNEIQ